MGRAYGKVLLKLDPTDETKPQLQWHNIYKGSQFGGSVLASFELYLVRSYDTQKMILIYVTITLYIAKQGVHDNSNSDNSE